ncbi:multimeric flavodoxin WrbA [Staphylococcus auricularis]|uniref:FMN-dependent NADPH-azoreductase n=1 Tax=Staphylococcus auricularis TaxID=29379 RepID=A0AAP8PQN1_9STAP|nr:flavodoxin family protein [Staphylococcus auricularis]MBM0867464.1 flavodoxin family protein [Staphylococcus auricularis]MCG7341566.1 flavodoxin family protein [Staphylococcus auricularis]MDC6327733.1 flavodoxin family protein [Staphylococcus auricularis]MDN4533685.1 flavodoxin family protein [Staphylococcus auricularis]PNZ68830.1 flavodoxin family protein [Staphylococcus auricularis]
MITVLYGGSRPDGNTVQLTQKALEGHDYNWIDLTEYHFNPVRDYRHNDKEIHDYTEDYKPVLDQMLASDVVIFASPIYWYSISASLKAFIDLWSETMLDPEYEDFKERMGRIEFRLILVGGDCPKVKGNPCIKQMQYTLAYIGGELTHYIIGTAERPGDIMQDSYALERAEEWRQVLPQS